MDLKDEGYEADDKDERENSDSRCSTAASDEDIIGQEHMKQTAEQQERKPAWAPSCYGRNGKDIYYYVGQEIGIYEYIDSYGAVMWPAALALCSFLDTNRERVNLQGKQVLELGAGTGLVAVVASLLGASVTATDLPDVLGNLKANVMRNTKGRCRYTPQVATLSWGHDLERTYPTSVYRYDYVLAADVVYHHDFLDELLVTMKHFCQPGTTLIWANKVRFETDLTFTENFKKSFHTSLLFEDGETDMKIFMATCREGERERKRGIW
ncbi:protein-lysine methyltransferase METTL21C-like [Centroberyx affinis]|uniref:protein-lysine methyltransferase METTL21C-like n=1 Tax=Centroberyx affinis TaxID=166261 RepID=UPI003A5BEB77